MGVAIGVVVPWVALWLERTRWLSASTQYEPLVGALVGVVVGALVGVVLNNARQDPPDNVREEIRRALTLLDHGLHTLR